MAGKKKVIKEDEPVVKEEVKEEVMANKEALENINKEEATEKVEEVVNKIKETVKKEAKNKYAIGNIVVISKDAEADLNGFKLFPQYKKYTYTVEAYDENTGVYSLRRLNLSLKLKEEFILSPEERAHDAINRKQF